MLGIPFIGPLKIPGRLLVTQLDSIWDQAEAINARLVLHSPPTFKSFEPPTTDYNAVNCGQFEGSANDALAGNGCPEGAIYVYLKKKTSETEIV